MKQLISAAVLFILLTPALAQRADQPAAGQPQPAPEQPGMSQAAAQAQAQADQEQAPELQQPPVPSAPPVYPPYPPQSPGDWQRRRAQREEAAPAPGIRPRAGASAYPVYREQRQFSIGARLLSTKEVEQKFSTPLGKHYLVVEVGVFPAATQPIKLRPESFTLRAGSDDQAFFAATPEDIAEALSGRRPRNVVVYPGMGVGYGGWGPGVSTGVGVGVGSGPYPRGGMPGANHRVMRDELRDKSLPTGSLTQPVAGYLYFPLDGKRAKLYSLELTRDGEKLSLSLPAPNN